MKNFLYAFSGLLLGCMVLAGAAVHAQNQKKTFPGPAQAASGTPEFVGTWNGTYNSNLVGPTKVRMIFQQRQATVTGTYLTANGAQGVMFGSSHKPQPSQLTANQTTPTCPGNFQMATTVNGNQMEWTFKGPDCLGEENGTGTATRATGK